MNNKDLNINGLKYFIYITTLNKDNFFIFLPVEIRHIIWNYSNYLYKKIKCYYCNNILFIFKNHIENTFVNENCQFINGRIKCIECFYD